MEKYVSLGPSLPHRVNAKVLGVQTKTVQTTKEALQDESDNSLPPLMNPTMLEASEDLTNLSHLNEPAGE